MGVVDVPHEPSGALTVKAYRYRRMGTLTIMRPRAPGPTWLGDLF